MSSNKNPASDDYRYYLANKQVTIKQAIGVILMLFVGIGIGWFVSSTSIPLTPQTMYGDISPDICFQWSFEKQLLLRAKPQTTKEVELMSKRFVFISQREVACTEILIKIEIDNNSLKVN